MIKLGYYQENWAEGIKSEIWWYPRKVPHLLISGITGGGKTVLSQLIVNQLIKEDCSIAICDFKAGGDWTDVVSDYSEYLDCDDSLSRFYDVFCKTIEDKGHKESYLIFDEFSSYALSKDTKEFKELMGKISHLAFMGRSFGFHLILISQQFNSKVLDTAIREQFGIKIYMGATISTESQTMLFPNAEIDKAKHLPSHCGYISTQDSELDIIQIPFIDDPKELKALLIANGKKYQK